MNEHDRSADRDTAIKVSQALKVQRERGFDEAHHYLLSQGVDPALASCTLQIGYDRRRAERRCRPRNQLSFDLRCLPAGGGRRTVDDRRP
jgi:hypothetical protein